MKSEPKTKPRTASVADFIAALKDESTRQDCKSLVALMKKATGAQPKMWGPSIVGFGSYHYKYASGREGDWFLTGFSPRSQALTLYIMAGFDRFESLMKRLGKFKTGKGCLYIKRLEDVDSDVLALLVDTSVKHLQALHRQDG